MAREQLGICAEANLHGSYLLLNMLDGQEAMLRSKLARLPQLLNRLAEHFSEAMLTGFVAISSHVWDTLYPWQRPVGLTAFPEFRSEHVQIRHSMADLLIQVRSDRADVNYIAMQQIYQLISPNVELVEQLAGFRYLDGRQLTGFIDAPFNPRGMSRRKVALIAPDSSALFAAGSYLHFYRLQLDLKHWLQLDVAQQEAIMGYQKVAAKPLANTQAATADTVQTARPVSSVLEQNMPYASLQVQGAIQQTFSADPQAFSQLWRTQLAVHEQPGFDSLLDFCRIDLAAAFFVPSVSFLEQAARGDLASLHLLE